MMDKQIDLYKPLISVRRQSTKGASSERHDGRNRNQIDDSRTVIPWLPYYVSELKSGPIRNPGAVPFQWEHKPGKAKAEIKPEVQVAPKLPPGRYFEGNAANMETTNGSVKSSFLNEEIKEFEKLARETDGRKSCSDSDDEYVDAHDSLSRTEPSYLNCGMSDISVMDDFDENRNSSTDRQANEFMMKRFLPAAKAIASETPTYFPQKQSQKTLQVKQGLVITGKPELRYGPSFAQKYSHFGLDTAVEEDDNDQDDDDDEKERESNRSFPAVCGLFSGLCLKSPFYLKNHVPSLNLRSRSPFSPATRSTLPEKDSDSSDSVVEITVLVDTLQKVRLPRSPSSPANDHQTISQIMNQVDETDSSTDDDIRESIDEEWERTKLQLLNSFRRKNRAAVPAYCHRKQPEIHVPQSVDDAEKHLNRPRTPGNFHKNSSARPLPPPLPKSPSDSWLSQALPLLSASFPQKEFATRLSFVPATTWNSSKEKLKSIPECDEDH